MRLPLICCLALTCSAADVPRVRPTTWAQPVIGAKLGNWYRVSTELYRCEQPSAAEMKVLESFGIKAVVNLREFHSDAEEAAGTSLKISEIKLDAGELTYDQLVAALKLVLAAPKPAVVHCWHGSDRTGAVVAGYRIAVEGWTPADALDEMVNGGYGHHSMYGNLRTLISGLDAAKLRSDLGLPAK
jgi:protein tyrosine/serine phosphatase